jgi:hypothetical protein
MLITYIKSVELVCAAGVGVFVGFGEKNLFARVD